MSDPKRPDESSEERDILTKARFAQYVLSEDAWFHTANELIAAMDKLEPQINQFWECLNAQFLVQNSDPEPEHSLHDVHMMLSGFAIENLCKGYLAGRLSLKEREDVKAGSLPESLRGTHDILDLVERTGMTLCDTEKELVKKIGQAIWRGRYPSPTSHKRINPFARIDSDISWIRTFLQKLRRHVGAKDSYRNAASPPGG
jgi:hypothetical protein